MFGRRAARKAATAPPAAASPPGAAAPDPRDQELETARRRLRQRDEELAMLKEGHELLVAHMRAEAERATAAEAERDRALEEGKKQGEAKGREEADALRADLAAARDAAAAAAAKWEAADDEAAAAKERAAALELTAAGRDAAVRAADERASKVEIEAASLREQLQKAAKRKDGKGGMQIQEQVSKLTAQLAADQAQRDALLHQLHETEARLAAQTARAESAEESAAVAAALKQGLDEAEKRCAELEAENTRLLSSGSESGDGAMLAELRAQVVEQHATAEEADAEAQRLHDRLATLEGQLQTAERMHAEHERARELLAEQLSRSEGERARLDAVVGELTASSAGGDELQARVTQLCGELARAHAERDDLERRLQTESAALSQAEALRDDLESRLTEAEGRVALASADAADRGTRVASEAEEVLKRLSDDLAAAKAEKSHLEGRMARIIDEHRSALQAARAEVRRASEEAHDAVDAERDDQLAEALARETVLKQRLEQMTVAAEKTADTIAASFAERDGAVSQLAEEQEAHASTALRERQAEHARKQLEDELARARSERDGFMRTSEEMSQQVRRLEQDVQLLTEEHESMEERLAAAHGEADAARAAARGTESSLRRELTDARAQLEAATLRTEDAEEREAHAVSRFDKQLHDVMLRLMEPLEATPASDASARLSAVKGRSPSRASESEAEELLEGVVVAITERLRFQASTIETLEADVGRSERARAEQKALNEAMRAEARRAAASPSREALAAEARARELERLGETLMAQLEAERSRAADLQQRLDEDSERAREQERRLTELSRERASRLEATQRALQEDYRTALDRVSELERQLAAEQGRLRAAADSSTSARQDASARLQELREARDEIQERDAEAERQRARIRTLEAELEEAQASITARDRAAEPATSAQREVATRLEAHLYDALETAEKKEREAARLSREAESSQVRAVKAEEELIAFRAGSARAYESDPAALDALLPHPPTPLRAAVRQSPAKPSDGLLELATMMEQQTAELNRLRHQADARRLELKRLQASVGIEADAASRASRIPGTGILAPNGAASLAAAHVPRAAAPSAVSTHLQKRLSAWERSLP